MGRVTPNTTPLQPCSAKSCSLRAWRRCERCNRPFCNMHARWLRDEFVRGSWATLRFVCYDCVPRTADEE